MSTFGKNNSIIKRKLAEDRTPNVISKTITFAHQASGFESFIDFTNLTAPTDMVANGFANPPSTVLPFLRLYRQNIKVESTYKGDLKDYEDFIVVNNDKLALQGITTEPGEIFIIKLVLPNNVDVDSILTTLSKPEEIYNNAKYGVPVVFTKTDEQLAIVTDVLSHVAEKNKGDTFESVTASTTQFTTALTGGVANAFIGSVLLPDCRVFSVPYNASNGKIYDPVTDTQFTTALTSGVAGAFSGVVLLPDGRVFCVPLDAANAKIYDPVANTQFTTALTGGSGAFQGGVLLPDGRVFCVPHTAANGKIYDPVANTQFTTALTGGVANAFVGVVLLPDGRVFCVPHNAANGKIYDPVANPQFTTALTGGSVDFYGGVLLPDGRVFCVPHNAANAKIYDPVADTQFTTALTGGSGAFIGGALLPDGRVFCVPFNAANSKLLAGSWSEGSGNNYKFPKAILLSAFLNKF